MELFDLSHHDFAKALIGKTLVIGKHRATVLDAKGFSKKENDKGIYKPITGMKPGEVFVPRFRGGYLFLIACLDGADRGGCVLITEIEVNSALFKGPGKVAEALGLQTHRATGELRKRPNGDLALTMDGIEPPAKAPSGAAKRETNGNGLGEAVLQKHMPNIVKKYRSMSERPGFQDFLNQLLESCPDESALRRQIK